MFIEVGYTDRRVCYNVYAKHFLYIFDILVQTFLKLQLERSIKLVNRYCIYPLSCRTASPLL